MARVVVLSPNSSTWGLAKDAKWVEQVLRECHATRAFSIGSIHHQDPMAYTPPPKEDVVDIQIHLEEPCRLAWPWAKINIVVVNPEWWPKTAWDWALATADRVVFKNAEAAALFPEVPANRRVVLGWRGPTPTPSTTQRTNKVLYVLGGSVNKVAAAETVVAAWRNAWPPLEVWGAPAAVESLKTLVAADVTNITWVTGFRSDEELAAAQKSATIHCVASAAEGFGYTLAEAVAVGALPLWTDIPAYKAVWGQVLGENGMIRTREEEKGADKDENEKRQGRCLFGSEDVEDALQSLLRLSEEEKKSLMVALQRRATERVTEWRQGWRGLLKGLAPLLKKKTVAMLPKLDVGDLPTIAVITVTRNRPGWFHNMSRNILLSDYPAEKLLWVVVDDGDFVMAGTGASGRVDVEVSRFQERCPHVRVKYVSLPKVLSVGAKRNRGCAAAIAADSGIEVFAMMDDDDHYPAASLRTRVAHLKALGVGCVSCARLPMYDCRRYISAMNVPPLGLAPAERVSEATLTFTRAFWEARGFPADVSVAEGEAFIRGREAETAEIPPEGVIVSFLHGGNSTSRRIPAAQEPNGCHYGFDDAFFSYLCERA